MFKPPLSKRRHRHIILIKYAHLLGKAVSHIGIKFLATNPSIIIPTRGGITKEVIKGFELYPGNFQILGIWIPPRNDTKRPPIAPIITTTNSAPSYSPLGIVLLV